MAEDSNQDPPAWSPQVSHEEDGTCRVAVTDEDGVAYPVARKLTSGQAELLVRWIGAEQQRSGRRVAEVIRDPEFMASSVLLVKQTRGRAPG